VDDIMNVVRWEQLEDIILCGHSYGGFVIAGVADALAERVSSLVFLDALLPTAGKSVLDINTDGAFVAAMLKAAADAGGTLVPAFPATLFGLNANDVAMVDALCTAHPLKAFCEPLELTDRWKDVLRKTYVRATGWGGYAQLGFHPYDQVQADDAWTKIDLDYGHELALDAPAEVANILLNA
jgi:pimeloyl-ACP methyl ester carboxylesterase